MFLREYAPMNAAGLFDRVFDVYQKSFWKQLAFSAIIGAVSFAFIFAAMIVMAVAVTLFSVNNSEMNFIFVFFVLLSAVLPLYIIWVAAADAGHIILSKQAFYGGRISFPFKELPGAALRTVTAIIMQFILSLPWFALIVFFIYLLIGGISGSDPMFFYWLIEYISSGWFVFLAFAATLGYLVYSNLFALAVPVAVFERKYFFSAIKKSFLLIKNEFWKVLGIRFLWTVVVYIFSYSAQGLWAAVMGVVSYGNSSSGISVALIMSGTLFQYMVTMFISFLVGPLGGIFTALLYFNQKIKREGLDIEIGIERL
ncbi:MAG: hypothetical protein FWE82_03585 [Defluviitaleaceae bacterium]|nr:hypothetical protein [Defluviitaleaceae bacterium]